MRLLIKCINALMQDAYLFAEPVSKNGLFEPFIHKNEHFAKPGSGQT
jgi:hypothetical protein